MNESELKRLARIRSAMESLCRDPVTGVRPIRANPGEEYISGVLDALKAFDNEFDSDEQLQISEQQIFDYWRISKK